MDESHTRARASSSGAGSNLNNMICNFSRGSGGAKEAANNFIVASESFGYETSNNRATRPSFANRTQSDHASAAMENMSKSMGTSSMLFSLRGRVSE
jgi:hypothetical protein